MAETSGRRLRRHAAPGPLAPDDDGHRIGEEALHFTKWFAQSKYKLMGQFVGELSRAPEERSPDRIRERYARAVAQGERFHRIRGVVTLLLAIGVIAAAATTVANLLDVPDALATDVAATTALLERLAAWSASATVLLVAIRLALDRYLERVDVAATFLAMQLAASPSVTRPSSP